jgi:hypothetical protein
MSKPPPSPARTLGESILHYLRTHPEAADNLEGIASWWLPHSGYEGSIDAVQAVLDALVAERRIARIDLADGRTLYQRVDKVSGAHPAWQPTPTQPRRS